MDNTNKKTITGVKWTLIQSIIVSLFTFNILLSFFIGIILNEDTYYFIGWEDSLDYIFC